MQIDRAKAAAFIELANVMTQIDINNVLKGRYDQAQLAIQVIQEIAQALRPITEQQPQPLKVKR